MVNDPAHNGPGPQSPIKVMGILNVTPDSFSDGGRFTSVLAIQKQVEKMIGEGAGIIDIGGESSRPLAAPVSPAEEAARVIPVIRAIRKQFAIPISVDTTKASIARQALDDGADMINDISALRFDPTMAALAATTGSPVVIMHMQGTPGDMQKDPRYDNVVEEILAFLGERIEWAVAHGIARDKIIVDPGIGFGKSIAHNLTIIKHLEMFKRLGCPVLLGHSRKAFIGKIIDREVGDRDTGTAIVSALCATRGVDIIRVHDVAGTVQAIKIAEAIEDAV